MKAIDAIRWAMQMTESWTNRLAADMRDAPLTQPTPRGGNHPLWVLGHLAFIEGAVPHVLFGEPNPVEHWAPLFATGTQPTTDPAAYPPFDEILATYRDLRARNLKMLEEIGEAGLDRVPKAVPPGFENEMTSFGRTLLIVAMHNMGHQGQLADARRAAGRVPFII